jgi:hypothetical protein
MITISEELHVPSICLDFRQGTHDPSFMVELETIRAMGVCDYCLDDSCVGLDPIDHACQGCNAEPHENCRTSCTNMEG